MGLITYGASLQNEFKGWPCLVQIGAGLDLVTNAQWFADEGTPTTKATAVSSSGEAGLDAKFLEVIKCITDAADEGWSQRYTYADEPRIKSGSHISALLWVGTTGGGTGITVKLRNSGGSSTTGSVVATDGDFSLVLVEDHTCSGTYVELVATKDASGTFYAGGRPTVMVGADAIELPPRRLVKRWRDFGADHDFDFTADSGGFVDADVTAFASNLTARADMFFMLEVPDGNANLSYELNVRRNGASTSAGESNKVASVRTNSTAGRDSARSTGMFSVILDHNQIFEYDFNHAEGSTNAGGLSGMSVASYEEWE